MERKYNFQVFGTQGGGLVREVAPNTYRFVEAPSQCTGFKIGDLMPEYWEIEHPVNYTLTVEEDYDRHLAMIIEAGERP